MSVDRWRHGPGARRDPLRQVRVRRVAGRRTRRRSATWPPPSPAARTTRSGMSRHRGAPAPPAAVVDHRGDRRRPGAADCDAGRRAKPDDTLLVDDLGGWVAALLDPARQPADDVGDGRRAGGSGARLRGAAGPGEPRGRALDGAADAGGARVRRRARARTNQALAGACDAVVLVVAGPADLAQGRQARRRVRRPPASSRRTRRPADAPSRRHAGTGAAAPSRRGPTGTLTGTRRRRAPAPADAGPSTTGAGRRSHRPATP